MAPLTLAAHEVLMTLAEIRFSIEPLPPLQELGATWTRLDAVGTHSFFLTWTWVGTLLRCVPCPPQMMLLRAKRGNDTVALAILTSKRAIRAGVRVTEAWLNATGDPDYDCITIEHNGFASIGLGEGELWSSFVEWFATEVTVADEAVLISAPAEKALAANNHLTVERRDTGFRTPLASFLDLEGFMSTLSRNSRQKLRRNFRDYERQAPLSIQVARDTQTALKLFSQMRALHIRSWTRRGKRHAFKNPFFETFHHSLIRAGITNGTVDLMRVSAGDKAIGYLYNFRRNGTISSYQSGFDDGDSRLRPGYVCHALAIAHYAAAGMSEYDFLAGANALKQSYGSERYEFCSGRIRGRKFAAQIEGLMRKIRMIVKRSPSSL
jgi:CelD/BcsL family acetyltransferase involved in cellulose biosynthesis